MKTSVSLGFLEGYGVVITIPTLDNRELIFSATGKKLEDLSMTHVSRSKEAQGWNDRGTDVQRLGEQLIVLARAAAAT